jgi:hypothetical protein
MEKILKAIRLLECISKVNFVMPNYRDRITWAITKVV